MKLEPATFRCEQHENVDYLTAAVRAAVGEGDLILTVRAPDNVVNLLGRSDRGEFTVIVDCPGNATDKAHPLTFEGKWNQ